MCSIFRCRLNPLVRLPLVAMLIAIGLNGTLFSSLASGAKLHVVFAVDSKAERVGKDLTVFRLWASLYTHLPKDSWQSYSVDSQNMSEPAILEKIRAVPVEADDTLMFVYVGHGSYDATLGTYLTPSATTGGVLSASRIVQEIKARGTRLGVTVIDCCNRERAPVPRGLITPYIVANPEQIPPLFDALFFQASGSVLLVSSSPGEYALVRAQRDGEQPVAIPHGPLFINAFAATLSDNSGSSMTWSQMIERTQSQLDVYFDLMVGPGKFVTLDDGTEVRQDRQTIQLRFYQ